MAGEMYDLALDRAYGREIFMKFSKIKKDVIEKLLGADIQHGPVSERIYLMKLGGAEPVSLIGELVDIVRKKGYTKIFAKVPASKAAPFLRDDFRKEACLPGFYQVEEDVLFLGRYFSSARKKEQKGAELDDLLQLALAKGRISAAKRSKVGGVRRCEPGDVEQMSIIYRDTFASYPFPIHDSDYLRQTMEANVIYFCLEDKGIMVALASAEMDRIGENVEMTDFATIPAWRGKGCATLLLGHMEQEMRKSDIKTAYTIARAGSAGMNITFARQGYRFAGRLINNTGISGSIESMNVWYHSLS
jgi:putative beta-lysine N-acetyltransferase